MGRGNLGAGEGQRCGLRDHLGAAAAHLDPVGSRIGGGEGRDHQKGLGRAVHRHVVLEPLEGKVFADRHHLDRDRRSERDFLRDRLPHDQRSARRSAHQQDARNGDRFVVGGVAGGR